MEVFGQFISMPLQKFFLRLDVSCGTLVYLFQFVRADCGLDDGMPFRLYNGVADTIHNVVRTILGRVQSIESRPFPFDRVHQASVYAVQLFLEFIDFLEQIAYGKDLVAHFLKQFFKFLLVLFRVAPIYEVGLQMSICYIKFINQTLDNSI